jgi:predicted nuclease of predicted toxin-antitoxin system
VKFLADESVERLIVERLRQDGHVVEHIREVSPGVPDDVVLERANREGVPLLTEDKDFGELIYRLGYSSFGVVLIRLSGLSSSSKALIVGDAVSQYGHRLAHAFTTIRPGSVRVRPRHTGNGSDDFA